MSTHPRDDGRNLALVGRFVQVGGLLALVVGGVLFWQDIRIPALVLLAMGVGDLVVGSVLVAKGRRQAPEEE